MAKVTLKTKIVKRPSAKTKTAAVPNKKSPVKSSERANLAKELKSLIPKLDEEGLAFLVKQAHVHLYNMQVDALNKTLKKDEERIKASSKKPAGKRTAGFSEIKMSETGVSYYIVYNGEWIAFSKSEISTLVKFAYSEGTEIEVKERVYNWLLQERRDLLYTASIGNKFDEKIQSLVCLIKESFKLKRKNG